MKYLISAFLLLIYIMGSFQSSWILVDFYWNRDDYTQKYCQFLDEGITQCRASCYLHEILEENHNETDNTKIITTQKVKQVEIITNTNLSKTHSLFINNSFNELISDPYKYDFYSLIFHPPKS